MKIQWKVFIGILFLTFELIAQNNDNPPKSSESSVEKENHRIYFQTGYGYGNLENANYEISKQYNTKSGIAYSALNQGDYIPIQITEDKPNSVYPSQGRLKWLPSQNNFEYRYKNNLRLYLEHRIFDSNGYENNYAYLPSKNVSSGYLNTKTIFFQEERYKLGGAYFFSIFENFNIGLIGNYYSLQQLSSKMNRMELNPYFSRLYIAAKSEQFYGWVPGIALEFKFMSKFEILYSFESVLLGSRNNQVLTYSVFPTTVTLDKIENKLIGNFNKLVFIYRPFSWFGLHLGFVKESYRKKYSSDLYISSAGVDSRTYITDIIISNSILRSSHFNQNLNYAYLQFEFSKGF